MSWLFSQALVAAFSEGIFSDGAPSALSSGNPTQQAFLSHGKTTAFSRPSRFGMTFRPLTDAHGEGLLTWYLAASRARTSASPARAPESMASEAACGDTWRGSWAKYDPATSSWRTAQPSLLGDSEECSVIWPRSGMTASGQCWELPTLAHPISATDSGLWPTPNAGDSKQTGNVTNWERRQAEKAMQGINLQESLAVAVKRRPMWRTPAASVVEPKSTVVKLSGRKPTDPQVGLADQVGGSLNPTWVEWLMGFPLGWTDLKPLATAKSPNAQPLPGDCLPLDMEAA